jgi:tRNA-specific 2-thiouridylase
MTAWNSENQGGKVVVAMSGGVDSSVSACLLRDQGYEIIGLFMRVGAEMPEESCSTPASESGRSHQGCCSAADAADARFVAGMLDIPFYALNFRDDFDRIIDYFADEYLQGRTPNPCVMCNNWLKFGKLLDYADAVGARYVATGHYARITEAKGRPALQRAVDTRKDQSYFLYGIDRNVLDRVLFPIGGLWKDEVREEAKRFGLPVSDKPDSTEICFVPDRNYARVVQERRPEAFRGGRIVDTEGETLGHHTGIGHFTVGQRRGLGVAAGEPIYVTEINVGDNSVVVGDRQSVKASSLVAERCNFLLDSPGDSFRASAKIRYGHQPAACTVNRIDDGLAEVNFDEPQWAITPGQSVVFYDDNGIVIGGGWIRGRQ